MKPSRFAYERPADLAGAIALNRREDLVVKILAGGQSLGPMLNFRLAQPDMLVDITRIPELKRVEVSDEGITVGACVTHADFEDGRVPDVTGGALPESRAVSLTGPYALEVRSAGAFPMPIRPRTGRRAWRRSVPK